MTAESPERRLHGVAVYNPDLLSRDELVAQFVARRVLLDQLVSDLRRPGFEQHQVIVGTRGMGKTTLLRRVRYAVEADPELSAVWMPLTFPEEQYNVGRLSDFYVNVIDALGDALEQAGRREKAAQLDDAIDALPKADPARADTVLQVLVDAASHIGRRLLLLVDNLDLVIERLGPGDEQWAFRELLSRESRILLIGAMPVIIGATYEYGAPFYDFFRIHELKGLTREETREVLTTLAIQQNATAVSELLARDPARIDTLHTLTGGNPRTIVLLFAVLAQGTEGDVRSDLEKLLDQCTPLYKSRFEALPAQAQQVVDAVAIHWDPISAGELAEKVGLEVNVVSSQLNRLVQQGVLEKVEYHPASKTGFQVAERFFNIWYLMRASRRVRRRLIWLVQFLRMFYGSDQLKTKAHDLLRPAGTSSETDRMRHIEFCLAVAQVIEDDLPTRSALESHAIRTLLTDHHLSEQLPAMLDLDGADASLRPVVDREKWVAEFENAVKELRLKPREEARVMEVVGSAMHLSREHRLALVRSMAKMSQPLRRESLKSLEAEQSWVRDHWGSSFSEQFLRAARLGFIDTTMDKDSAVSAATALGIPELAAPFLYEEDDAVERLQQLVETTGSHFAAVTLAGAMAQRGRMDEAFDLIQSELNAERTGNALLVYGTISAVAGRHSEAVQALEEFVKRFPDTRFPVWRFLAVAHFKIGKIGESITEFERALSVDRSPEVLRYYSTALEASGRVEDAERALREILATDPRDEEARANLMALLVRTGREMDAVQLFDSLPAAASVAARLNDAAALMLADRQQVALSIFRDVVSDPALEIDDGFRILIGFYALDADDDARRLLKGVLKRMPPDLSAEQLAVMMKALHLAVRMGRAGQVADAILEAELEERFRPLYEALRVAEAGDADLLNRLAPELREPAEQILQTWFNKGLDSPKKRATKKSSKRRRR